MSKIKNSYFWPLIIEFIIVFILLSIGLIIESLDRNILLLSYKSLNSDILSFIFRETLIVTIIFVVSFNFIKRSYYSIARNISITLGQNEQNTAISILSEAYLVCASILAMVNIRPIIHTTYLESNIQNFTYDFARYDSFFSVLTLLVLAIPLIYLIYTKSKSKSGLKILGVLVVLFLVGVVNSFTNFEARALETSASWTTKNWEDLSTKATVTLNDSKTDEEKATAYFWLGVAENRRGNYDKAVEYQLLATSLYPRYAGAYSSLSNAYSALGENTKALESAKKCIKYDPNYAWCYNSLMNYYIGINDTKKALINAKTAMDLDLGNIELREIYRDMLDKSSLEN